MPKIRNTRKARFQSALARVEMTQGEWAKKNGMDRSHLNRVLNGRFVSPPVLQKLDAFIEHVESQVAA